MRKVGRRGLGRSGVTMIATSVVVDFGVSVAAWWGDRESEAVTGVLAGANGVMVGAMGIGGIAARVVGVSTGLIRGWTEVVAGVVVAGVVVLKRVVWEVARKIIVVAGVFGVRDGARWVVRVSARVVGVSGSLVRGWVVA